MKHTFFSWSFGKNPTSDWYTIVACFALACILVFALDGGLFLVFTAPSPAVPTSTTVSNTTLMTRSEVIDAAARLRAQASSTPVAPPRDPSL